MADKALSVSAVQTYLQCSRRWWYQYRSNLPSAPTESAAMQLGTAFHAAAAGVLRANDTSDATIEAALRPLATAVPDSVLAQAARLARYHLPRIGIGTTHQALIHDGVPQVEVEVTARVGQGEKAFDLRGFVDAVLEDVQTGETWLVDWKVRGHLSPDDAVRLDKQLYIYAALLGRAGVQIDRIAQVQILADPPAEPRLNKGQDPTRFSSYHAGGIGKTTEDVLAPYLAALRPEDYLQAEAEWGTRVVPDETFRRWVELRHSAVPEVFSAFVAQALRLRADTAYTPILHSATCTYCPFLRACANETGD